MAVQRCNAGDDCPQCGRVLKESRKGWIYCPAHSWTDPASGCQYKGNWAQRGGKATDRPTSAITPLATPSVEQSAIFAAAAALFSAVSAFLLIIARAGTGKTTCLVQCARIWQEQGLSALFLCFAKRDRKAAE